MLEQASVADLGYGDPRGSEWLRKELAGWLARTRGLRAEPDDIIIVTGVAQALALLAQGLAAVGPRERGIAVEDPGSRGSRDELAYWGLRPVPIPVDDQGLVVDDLMGTRRAGRAAHARAPVPHRGRARPRGVAASCLTGRPRPTR